MAEPKTREVFISRQLFMFLGIAIIILLALILGQKSSTNFVIMYKKELEERHIHGRHLDPRLEDIGKLEMARSRLLISEMGKLPILDMSAKAYPLKNMGCKDYWAIKPYRLKICIPNKNRDETPSQEYLRLRIAGNVKFESYVSDILTGYLKATPSSGLIDVAPGNALHSILAGAIGADVIMVEESLENALRIRRSIELSHITDTVTTIVAKILPAQTEAEGTTGKTLMNLDQISPFIRFKRGILKVNLEDKRTCNLILNSNRFFYSPNYTMEGVIMKRSLKQGSCFVPTLTALYKAGFKEQGSIPLKQRDTLHMGNLDRWFTVYGYTLMIRAA